MFFNVDEFYLKKEKIWGLLNEVIFNNFWNLGYREEDCKLDVILSLYVLLYLFLVD